MNREPSPTAHRTRALPRRLSPAFGLDEAIERLGVRLSLHRFMTITGPGGLGKTTLALAFARTMAVRYEAGVCFVDLSLIDQPGLVPRAIATALGLPQNVESVATALSLVMAQGQLLVVLDSCEHPGQRRDAPVGGGCESGLRDVFEDPRIVEFGEDRLAHRGVVHGHPPADLVVGSHAVR